MYLSKLDLNSRSQAVRREAMRPYELHRTVMSAFPDGMKEGDDRVLFRMDTSRSEPGMTLLVKSGLRPDWGPVSTRYSVLDTKIREFNPTLVTGQRRYFRLRANPTVKRDGKRRSLNKLVDQERWITQKAAGGGFLIESLSVTPEGMITDAKGNNKMSWYSVLYEGILQISSPELFSRSIELGIGPGKGLGFGLLSIAPMPGE